MTEYPKVLVISAVIPETIHAGNIQLYRLFKGYPPERLLILGSSDNASALRLNCLYKRWKPALARWDHSRFSKLARSLCAADILSVPSVKSMVSLVGGFQPDVVVTVMQGYAYFSAAYAFARAARLPLVVIVHDIPEDFDWVYSVVRGKQRANNAEIYRYASKRHCISPEMRDFLRDRYGVDGDVLYPSCSEGVVPRPAHESRLLRNGQTFTLGYAGSLGYGYGHQLSEMLPALKDAGAQLRIYSSGRLPTSQEDMVVYSGFADSPVETWRRIKAECDAVILPYGWPHWGHQELYRTHFPSKLPEYLTLGTPVVIVGPPHATGVKWGLENPEAALVITEDDPVRWRDALRELRQSPDLREQLAENAMTAGLRDFDPVRIREKFLSGLLSAYTNWTN